MKYIESHDELRRVYRALVGEIVRTGIEQDWPYIFTDPEFEPLIEARFAAIKQGFARIRAWRATP
jgi:hypothetical protein